MGYTDQDIQKVREAVDIVALFGERVPVRQRGRDFWCCCPVHNEKTPSCKIDPTLQRWHCFGCGAGGDAFDYVQKTEDLNFPESVQYLADKYHIPITDSASFNRGYSGEKARLKAACEEAANFFQQQLMRSKQPQAQAARDYLSSRQFGSKVCKTWGIGFALGGGTLVKHLRSLGFSQKEIIDANLGALSANGALRDRFFNRVMFPICDVKGNPIAFGGRVVGSGEPKYLNTSETPIFHKSEVLFGLHKAKASMTSTGTALVCEGYTDVIALHEAGITFAVATLGTALTVRHIRVLSSHASKRIVYLFDGDEAGQRAADRALQFVSEAMTPEFGQTRELVAVTLPDNLDPADFVAERGADALQKLIDSAEPLIMYGIRRRLARHDLLTAEGRSAALVDALSVLAPIKKTHLASDYARQIASACRAREEEVLKQLSQLKPPVNYEQSYQRKSVTNSGGRAFIASGSKGSSSCASGASVQQSEQQAPLPTGLAGAPSDALASGSSIARQQSVKRTQLSPSERTRLRIEREVLFSIVRNPLLFIEVADKFKSISWHDSLHEGVAAALYSELSEDFNLSSAELAGRLSQSVPHAGKVLEGGFKTGEDHTKNMLSYLIDQLCLADQEDELNDLQRQILSMPPDSSEYESLFEQIVRLQKELAQKQIDLSRNHPGLGS